MTLIRESLFPLVSQQHSIRIHIQMHTLDQIPTLLLVQDLLIGAHSLLRIQHCLEFIFVRPTILGNCFGTSLRIQITGSGSATKVQLRQVEPLVLQILFMRLYFTKIVLFLTWQLEIMLDAVVDRVERQMARVNYPLSQQHYPINISEFLALQV